MSENDGSERRDREMQLKPLRVQVVYVQESVINIFKELRTGPLLTRW